MTHPIAIIGAGPAGLACARTLAASGRAPRLFDKGRAAGGRLATRRAEAAGLRLQFDHGAPLVAARGQGFAAALDALGAAARPWPDPDSAARIGLPGISALGRGLAAGLELASSVQVAAITREGAALWLIDAAGTRHGPFAHVVVAVPAPQAAPLLAPLAPGLAEAARATRADPCWTLMLAFARDAAPPPGTPLGIPAGAAASESGQVLGQVVHDSAKPGRPADAACWVAHATPDFARARLEETPEAVAPTLLEAFRAATGILAEPLALAAHRWRYARIAKPLGAPFLHDAEAGVSACGDWCLGPDAADAWESGVSLGQSLLT